MIELIDVIALVLAACSVSVLAWHEGERGALLIIPVTLAFCGVLVLGTAIGEML